MWTPLVIPVSPEQPFTDYLRLRLRDSDGSRHVWDFLKTDTELKDRPPTNLGGAAASASWGKFWLSVLNVYNWEGITLSPPGTSKLATPCLCFSFLVIPSPLFFPLFCF